MKKALLISCEGLGNGGVQAVMMSIVRNLVDKVSFDVVVFTKERRYYDDEVESYGGNIFRFPTPDNPILARFEFFLRGIRLYTGLKKILREGNYDVIHCHNEFDGAFALKAAKKAGVPVRVMHTHVFNRKSKWYRNLFWKCCRKMINKYATDKIGCSDRSCAALYGEDKDFLTVNNPYNSKKFLFCEKGKSQSPIFTQIGSILENKNQSFSLEVISEIKRKYPDVHFNMLGNPGPYFKKIQDKIETLGLSDNVEIYPHDADSVALLCKSDFFLFPSKYEGFGIVAIEAQAVGVKVVASDTVPKAVDCGGVSFLPLSKGAKYWADFIINEFENSGGIHKQYDCSEFAEENVIKSYEQIYFREC